MSLASPPNPSAADPQTFRRETDRVLTVTDHRGRRCVRSRSDHDLRLMLDRSHPSPLAGGAAGHYTRTVRAASGDPRSQSRLMSLRVGGAATELLRHSSSPAVRLSRRPGPPRWALGQLVVRMPSRRRRTSRTRAGRRPRRGPDRLPVTRGAEALAGMNFRSPTTAWCAWPRTPPAYCTTCSLCAVRLSCHDVLGPRCVVLLGNSAMPTGLPRGYTEAKGYWLAVTGHGKPPSLAASYELR
jgi:hypothetical protein